MFCSISYRRCSGRISKGRLRMSASWRTDRRVNAGSSFLLLIPMLDPPTVTFPCLGISFSLSSNKAMPLSFLSILTLISYALKFVSWCSILISSAHRCVQPPFPSLWLSSLPLFHANFMCCVFKLPWCWLYMHGCRTIYWNVGSFSGATSLRKTLPSLAVISCQ